MAVTGVLSMSMLLSIIARFDLRKLARGFDKPQDLGNADHGAYSSTGELVDLVPVR